MYRGSPKNTPRRSWNGREEEAEEEKEEEMKKETDREADCGVKGENAFNQLHSVEKKKPQEPALSVHCERQTLLLRLSGETRRD